VITRSQLEAAGATLAAAADGDATIWMAYPKASSKKYKCEFNRDSGWPTLGAAGFEPVLRWQLTRTGPPCAFVGWST
jgi:hypothetical protein